MKQKLSKISPGLAMIVLVIIISAAMHGRHFGKELTGIHVWRQTETQSTIQNFYGEDMNIFHPRRNDRGNGDGLHRMEFPLMQWMVAGLYKIFGNHLFISRIFMFIVGIFSVFGIYKMLKILFDNEYLAIAGAWAFNFSPSFYYFTINPMPDNFALCCGIWGIVMFFTWIHKNTMASLLLSGLFLGLASLCKLPFILYFSVPLIYFLLQVTRRKQQSSTLNLQSSIFHAAVILIFTIPSLLWYISVVPQWHGNGIVKGILEINVPASVLLDNLQHHLLITLTESLLNYGSALFFLAGFYFIIKKKIYKKPLFPVFAGWGILLVLYFLFELNMIGKSHDYYLFPFLPLLFILVGYGAFHLFYSSTKYAKTVVLILIFSLPLLAYLRMDGRWDPERPGFNKDLLIYKDELRAAVPKDALCIAGNDQSHFIFFYYIDKKGWGFDNNNLSGGQLQQMIDRGAQYLYSDSREVENKADISAMLGKMILEKGSVRIFNLNYDR